MTKKLKTHAAAEEAVRRFLQPGARLGINEFIDRVSEDISYFGHLGQKHRQLYTQKLKACLWEQLPVRVLEQLKPIERGNKIVFKAIDDLSGDEFVLIGTVTGRAKDLGDPDWAEADDDVYVAQTPRHGRFIVLENEIIGRLGNEEIN